MAKPGSVSFKIPTEMRALAEKSAEQARQAFETFMSAATQKQVAGARAGAKRIGELAVRLAERNIASSFEFAQQLVRAKDSEEVVALHADYVKRQVAALTDQAKELTKEAVTGPATQH